MSEKHLKLKLKLNKETISRLQLSAIDGGGTLDGCGGPGTGISNTFCADFGCIQKTSFGCGGGGGDPVTAPDPNQTKNEQCVEATKICSPSVDFLCL
ncbi:hypothetical protein [Tenacibaculum ovolyticum]|uniref:hypothetical protein n=1 Tax=Tenacibaculum ovolyticum TaxID=104270 RepID=UPI003BABD9C2